MSGDIGRHAWTARMGRWLSWIVPEAQPRGGVEWWRGRILAVVLLVCTVVGFLVLVPNLAVAVRVGAWSVVGLDVVVYGVLVWLLTARRRSLADRARGILLVGWALGTFFSWGWAGAVAGPVWLMAVPVLAGVLLGVRSTLIALGLTATTTVVIGLLARAGLTPWTGGLALALPTPGAVDAWVIIATNLLLVAGLGALGAAVLARGLAEQGAARARAEEELLLIGRALEQGDALVLLLAPDGRIARANAADLLGKGPVASGEAIESLALQPIDEAPAGLPWRDVLQGSSWTGRCRTGGGENAVTCQVTLSPVRGADGAVTHALCIVRDISRQAALEERLRVSAKLEAVGTMVGGIAHDFNNLLQPVLGNAGELRRLLPPGHPGTALLDDIETGAERGRGLVRRILTFSRGIEVPRVPTALAGVVDEALRLIDVRSTPRLTVEVHVAGDPWVLADPAELHHLVVNLVTNARDAMPDGGALVITVAREHPADGTGAPAAVITVRDSGMGMDESTQRRMFEPFFSTKPPGRGTGLGLATVHGTVRALGGSVDVRSVVGAGTTIAVRLPAIAPPAAALPEAEDAPTERPSGAACVFVVDDDDQVRRATVRQLVRAGYRTIDAGDPRDALQRVQADPRAADVVLTDLTMPHLSGLALADALRTAAPHVPVVLMTGMVDAADAADARAAGVAGVLAKPFTSRELADAVAEAVANAVSVAVGPAVR